MRDGDFLSNDNDDNDDNSNDNDNNKDKMLQLKSHTKSHIPSSFEKEKKIKTLAEDNLVALESLESTAAMQRCRSRTECIYLRHKFCRPCCGIICQGRSFRNVQPLDSSSADPRIQESKDRGGRTQSRTDKSPITGRSYD